MERAAAAAAAGSGLVRVADPADRAAGPAGPGQALQQGFGPDHSRVSGVMVAQAELSGMSGCTAGWGPTLHLASSRRALRARGKVQRCAMVL